jgi:methylated-DNA-[protein]-cysteine S-methyltransferase
MSRLEVKIRDGFIFLSGGYAGSGGINTGDSIMNQYTSFNKKCYELLKRIPKGKVTTYREMANALGTKAWRAVGTAMAKNNDLITTPCHRVVRSDGSIGKYALGADKKAELLESEGVEISNGRIINLDRFLHRFNS